MKRRSQLRQTIRDRDDRLVTVDVSDIKERAATKCQRICTSCQTFVGRRFKASALAGPLRRRPRAAVVIHNACPRLRWRQGSRQFDQYFPFPARAPMGGRSGPETCCGSEPCERRDRLRQWKTFAGMKARQVTDLARSPTLSPESVFPRRRAVRDAACSGPDSPPIQRGTRRRVRCDEGPPEGGHYVDRRSISA